jgi:hypothetical protein
LYNNQQRKLGKTEDIWFKKDLLSVLAGLNQMMSKTSPEFRGAQTNALKSFGSLIADLGKIFDNKELSSIIRDFVMAVKYDQNLKLLNMEKLQFIGTLASSDLFVQSGMNWGSGDGEIFFVWFS